MTLLTWANANREQLGESLPEALVLLPIGATEQHGPHLATGTDALLAAELTRRAAELAHERSSRPLVLAPVLPFGASDHHLMYGGTLSLTTETLLAVLADLCRSVAADGGRRLLIVNGHGGNTGICHAAAAAASVRHDLAVAHLDYWHVADEVPGHAGEFETSLMLGLDNGHSAEPAPPRDEVPEIPGIDGVSVHSAAVWRDLGGYTGRPENASAEDGKEALDRIARALAGRIVAVAEAL
jgi:creatinine amidohydrolase